MGLARKQWFMMSVLVIGTFITVLNQTVVTPALPSIMTEFAVDAATAQWLTTGFTLVNAIMIPITAYLQDRFSVRRLFLVSMGLFAVGSFFCGLGNSFMELLIGRLVQAGGAGVLMPMVMTVLMVTFPVDKRGVAMGIFGLVVAFAPAIGPTVAGIVIDTADWHILFFGITFLSVFIIFISLFALERKAPDSSGDIVLDKLSVVLSTVGFGTLLYGFSAVSGGSGWVALVTIIIGAATLVWFFRRQLSLEHPMLRVQVLSNRKFLVGTIIGMLVQAALLAAGILMPIYIQTLCGYPATVSGLVLMPGAILMGIMGPVAGKLFDKRGPRTLGITGMTLLTITTFGFSVLTLEAPLWYVTVIYTVRMFAMSLVNMPITTWGMNALDNSVLNHGTSVNNTLRKVAGSLGTALIISVSSIVGDMTQPALGDVQSTMLGINVAFAVCGLLCIAGLIMTIVLVKDRPRSVVSDELEDRQQSVLRTIMNKEVFTLPETATVEDAINLFLDKNISAAPIVNEKGEATGFISDGDILRRLSTQSSSFIDPIVMIMSTVKDEQNYDDKISELMGKKVHEIGVKGSIGVDVHADLAEVCRVLGENHLKKVPVLENNKIVGVINRSDITKHTMKAYMEKRNALNYSEQEELVQALVPEINDQNIYRH